MTDRHEYQFDDDKNGGFSSSTPKASSSEHIPLEEGLVKLSKLEQELKISDREEPTSEEAVRNSFANICGALMISRSTIAVPILDLSLSRRDKEVANKLVAIGDEIDRIFGSDIENLLNSFGTDELPLDILRKIYKGLFASGRFTWGRIIAFLNFGIKLFFRSAMNCFVSCLQSLWNSIVDALATIFAERIFGWIAHHGGWNRIAASNYQLALGVRTQYWSPLWVATSVGIVFLFLRYWRSTP
ncbi:hypothetical protein Aperf_G00000115349 [Anoplocephala perfoliata]